jgi:phosphomethylpyrimidine synthase
MKITQDVRDYAKRNKIDDVSKAIETGMREKSEQFKRQGGKLYSEI